MPAVLTICLHVGLLISSPSVLTLIPIRSLKTTSGEKELVASFRQEAQEQIGFKHHLLDDCLEPSLHPCAFFLLHWHLSQGHHAAWRQLKLTPSQLFRNIPGPSSGAISRHASSKTISGPGNGILISYVWSVTVVNFKIRPPEGMRDDFCVSFFISV